MSDMDDRKRYLGIILNVVFPVAEILLVCLLGPKLLKFFLPFVIGWIIAMIANPLVKFLESKVKIVRKHSSVIIVVVVLAGVIGLGYFLISRLVLQAIDLARDLPELYAVAQQEMQNISLRFDHIFQMLPDNIQASWETFTGNVGQTVSVMVQKIASPTVEVAGSVAKGIPGALVYTIVTILSSYFFIAERDRIIEFWKRYLPEGGGHYVGHLKEDTKRLVGGYFLAQFKIMFVVGAILMAGFMVLGISYSLLLAILIAMLDFLPLFGTGTVLIPWALVKLLGADYPMAVGLALLYVLTQVVRQVIQPKIVGDTMGLPPLMTLVFLYLGFKVHGISGMILAVPVGILVLNLYQYGAFDSMIANGKLLAEGIQELRKPTRIRGGKRADDGKSVKDAETVKNVGQKRTKD